MEALSRKKDVRGSLRCETEYAFLRPQQRTERRRAWELVCGQMMKKLKCPALGHGLDILGQCWPDAILENILFSRC